MQAPEPNESEDEKADQAPPGAEDLIETLASEFAQRLRRGEQPTLSEYEARYPELASDIRDLFPMLLAMERAKLEREASSSAHATLGPMQLKQLGDFRIIRQIGRGGMGVVYEAEQVSLQRNVAIKVLPQRLALDPKGVARFEREALMAAKLHHTHIIPIHAVGQDQGLRFYVMQLVRGVSLDKLRLTLAARDPSQPVPRRIEVEHRHVILPGAAADELSREDYFRSAVTMLLQAALAVQHAHEQHVLHRDLKPGNLMLDEQGTVWVADFGLARAIRSTQATTLTSGLAGTLRYLPPEQLLPSDQPRDDRRLGIAGDVYGLGLTLYEMLTLRPAYEDADASKLMRLVAHSPPPLPRQVEPRIPRKLEAIVLRAIARDPAQRYESAGALAQDLQHWLSPPSVIVRVAASLRSLLPGSGRK